MISNSFLSVLQEWARIYNLGKIRRQNLKDFNDNQKILGHIILTLEEWKELNWVECYDKVYYTTTEDSQGKIYLEILVELSLKGEWRIAVICGRKKVLAKGVRLAEVYQDINGKMKN